MRAAPSRRTVTVTLYPEIALLLALVADDHGMDRPTFLRAVLKQIALEGLPKGWLTTPEAPS